MKINMFFTCKLFQFFFCGFRVQAIQHSCFQFSFSNEIFFNSFLVLLRLPLLYFFALILFSLMIFSSMGFFYFLVAIIFLHQACSAQFSHFLKISSTIFKLGYNSLNSLFFWIIHSSVLIIFKSSKYLPYYIYSKYRNQTFDCSS